jgi:hypothetical protein
VFSELGSGTVLCIEVRGAERIVAAEAPEARVVLTRFAALDAALLQRVGPDCVMVPLVAARFDAVQAIERLIALRYCGKVAVVTAPLPRPEMVLGELRGVAGATALRLIEVRD